MTIRQTAVEALLHWDNAEYLELRYLAA